KISAAISRIIAGGAHGIHRSISPLSRLPPGAAVPPTPSGSPAAPRTYHFHRRPLAAGLAPCRVVPRQVSLRRLRHEVQKAAPAPLSLLRRLRNRRPSIVDDRHLPRLQRKFAFSARGRRGLEARREDAHVSHDDYSGRFGPGLP